MPIPFIMLGAAAMAGAAGVTKGASAISSNSKADHMVKAAQDACQQAQEALEEQRAETTNKLETLGTIKLDICRMKKSLQTAINPVSTFGMVFV